MSQNSLGVRFLSAFNDIESHFRASIDVNGALTFTALTQKYVDRHRPIRPQRDALAAFALLRNAIAHGRYYNGQPIAEPVEQVVLQIEQLRDQLRQPPTALSVAAVRNVVTVRDFDSVGTALEHVRTHDFSQFPVYDSHNAYQGLLTTNTVARWLASQLRDQGGLAEDQTVAEVLHFAETHERATFLPRPASIVVALQALTHPPQSERAPTALLITHSGRESEQPLALLVVDDIPELVARVSLA